MSDGEIKERARQAEGQNLLLHFHALLRLSRFYSKNNSVLEGQINDFLSATVPLFGRDGDVEIGIHQAAIFVNRTRIKFDLSKYHISKAILSLFQALEIGGIIIRAGLTGDELHRFAAYLGESATKPGMDFDRFSREAALACPHIAIERTVSGAQPPSGGAARMYFLGISHLKEIFAEKQPVVNYNLTKRWVQSMIVHLSLEESYLIGLTCIKNFDDYTLNHSVNVCVLALALGRRLGLTRRELIELGAGALFHDLGKLDIPNEILEKPSALSAEEWAIMEGHSQRGAERLVGLAVQHGIPAAAIQIALEHHEKHDMSGYPLFVKKSTIGFYSKIVKVVDYFDALTTKRNYRKKVFTTEEAAKLMLEKSGVEFDPVILKAFVRMIGSTPIGSLVFLSTGEMGIIFENNEDPSFAQRPKVKLVTDIDGNMLEGPVVDLVETDPETGKYLRTIITTLDPDKYGIDVSQYFLAQAV
jgi:putative nucleotidyltransferase with HDIG domain